MKIGQIYKRKGFNDMQVVSMPSACTSCECTMVPMQDTVTKEYLFIAQIALVHLWKIR